MTPIADARLIDRLGSLCGMLGSDHVGERANAASAATRVLQQIGITWRELVNRAFAAPAVVRPQPRYAAPPPDADLFEIIAEIQSMPSLLSEWEHGYVADLARCYTCCGDLSTREMAVLHRILSKIRRHQSV